MVLIIGGAGPSPPRAAPFHGLGCAEGGKLAEGKQAACVCFSLLLTAEMMRLAAWAPALTSRDNGWRGEIFS